MDNRSQIRDWLKTWTAPVPSASYPKHKRAISSENVSAVCVKPSPGTAREIPVVSARMAPIH